MKELKNPLYYKQGIFNLIVADLNFLRNVIEL